jgi:uncharacterized membrane protein
VFVARSLSRRKLRRQLLYAAQGISIGLAGTLVIFCGIKLISRLMSDQPIGHKWPIALVILLAVLVSLLYRFVVMTSTGASKSVARSAVSEFSKGERDKSRSA